ncbi:IS5 family transposase [Umezawaea endophytica]|uniref:IS5 family transposase n=1 Tax=Umezawaea endophytica TaxID=1654476 RepID=A0A9X2VMA9_9PSEU|nr:IS5 family transposase [Umezawaea endophytica]MCS7479245.1 IS5 family transposase [Umezawaea endophytica]
MSQRLVPDELWALVEPLIPGFTARPQGGGTTPVDDRAVFTAIVFVLTSGCQWRLLPPSFGVTVPTAHRRFTDWTKAGLWRRMHRAVLDELGTQGLIDWSRAVLDGASVRAKKGGTMTGRNPVDRGKPGSKIHVLTDRHGIPLSVAVSGANTHDSQALKPLVMAIPAIRSRRGRRRKPDKLHGDKAYESRKLREWVRDRGIGVRIARKGIESSERLGRHRWVVERTIAWTFNYRRLAMRYERHGANFCAFLTLAAALTCYKKLPT